MRGDATFCHDVDFGPESVWGVAAVLRGAARVLLALAPGRRDRAARRRGTGADLRHGRRQSGAGRPRASSTTAGAGARSRNGRSRARSRRPTTCSADGGLSTDAPAGEAEPRRFSFDPAHPVPTIGGLYCSIGELPAEGAGMEQAWARLLNPVLRLRDLLTPGPADQKESPAFFGSTEPYPRLSERPDVLVYQTEPLTEPVEVTGPDDRAPLGLVERARHGLHGEARRRPPGERGLPRRLRHAPQRLGDPLPLPRGVRAGGADGAGHRRTR